MGFRSNFFQFSLFALVTIQSASPAHIDSVRRSPPAPPGRQPIKARQDPAANPPASVSLEFFPRLGWCTDYCIDYNYVYQCDTKTIPCSEDPKKECVAYDKECYCSQATSLYCAWGCPWFEWFKVEDWYLDVCPETPKVNFDALPHCAKQCIIDQINDGGCVNHSRNCICLKNTLYDCPSACNDGDKAIIKTWWGEQCRLTPEEVDYSGVVGTAVSADASQTLLPSGASEISRATDISDPGQYKEGPRKLKWYEIYGLVIVLVTVVMVCAVYFFIWQAQFKYIRAIRKQSKESNDVKGKGSVKRSSVDKTGIAGASTEKISTPRASGEKK